MEERIYEGWRLNRLDQGRLVRVTADTQMMLDTFVVSVTESRREELANTGSNIGTEAVETSFGMEWGYSGGGPHALARTLLWDATDGDMDAVRLTHKYVQDVVSSLPAGEGGDEWEGGYRREWTISRSDILAWIDSQHR